MKKILQLKLKILAKMVLAKYKPKIVGISGSVGKSSAKEAIFAVLSVKYRVRHNIKNYNNEIGLPLTILGLQSPGKSILGWFFIFWKALSLLIIRDKKYPEILILEMGVDRPGDMDYLLSITKCDVGVITLVGQSHLEYFGSVEKILKEKSKIVKKMKSGAWAVLNFDDNKTEEISKEIKNKIITFGMQEGAKLKASDVSFSFVENNDINNLRGLSFKLNYNGSVVPVLIPDVLGQTAVYASLVGVALGVIFDINLVKISEALRRLKLPPSRMNLINGIKNSLIIDDTYNSSPESTKASLDTMSRINIKGERYAVLGDMLELGSASRERHLEVGRYVAQLKIDKLIVVGERSLDIMRGAQENGLSRDFIFHFNNSEEAGRFIQERISQGDLILVKGSQGVRMEKIVKEIMAEPMRAQELLCRQDKGWS